MLTKLLAHPDVKTFEITVLVRSEEKAHKLETFGVKTAVGSFDDIQLVEKLSETAHVVFSVVRILLADWQPLSSNRRSRLAQTICPLSEPSSRVCDSAMKRLATFLFSYIRYAIFPRALRAP